KAQTFGALHAGSGCFRLELIAWLRMHPLATAALSRRTPEADIARVLGVSKPTLRKHCGTELDTGATRANSKVADFLFYGICGGTGKPAFKDERARVTAAIFWMKTRGGWSETSTHRHTGAANGDPIEVEVGTVRERLTRRIARIAAARTTGGVPET